MAVLNNKKKATNVPFMRKNSLLASVETTFSELSHKNFVHHNTQPSHADPRRTPRDDRPYIHNWCDPYIHNATYPTWDGDDTFVLKGDYEVHMSPIFMMAIIKWMSDKGQGKTHFSHTVVNSRNPNSRLSCKVDAYFRTAPDTYDNMKVAFLDYFRDDINKCRDGKLFLLTNNADNTSVAKVIPSVQPSVSIDYFTVWTEEDIIQWTAQTSVIAGDISMLVVDNERRARGIAIYKSSDACEASPRMTDATVMVMTMTSPPQIQRSGPGCGGSALIGRDMKAVNMDVNFTCVHLHLWAMPPINMPPDTLALNDKTGTNKTGTTSIAAHLQIDTFKLLSTVSADYAWICTVCGHEGASSTHCCMWCEQTDTEIQCRTCATTPAQQAAAKPRTLASIAGNYATHLQAGATQGEAKLAGRGNIHRKPLLDIDPCFISTIVLHIFLGTWTKLFELFLDDVRRDLDGKSEEIIGIRAACAALALEVTEKQKNIGDVDKEMKEEKSDAADLQKQLKEIRERHRLSKRPSTYDAAKSAGYTDAEWAETAKCMELIEQSKTTMADSKQERKVYNDELIEMTARLEKLEADVKSDAGPYERGIEAFLKSIHVERQAYYSGAFVGNHVIACLVAWYGLSQVTRATHHTPHTARRSSVSICTHFSTSVHHCSHYHTSQAHITLLSTHIAIIARRAGDRGTRIERRTSTTTTTAHGAYRRGDRSEARTSLAHARAHHVDLEARRGHPAG